MSVSVADQIIAVGVPHGYSRVCSDQQREQGVELETCRQRRVGAAFVVTNYDGDWAEAEPGVVLNHPAIGRYASFGNRLAASDRTVVVIEDEGLTLYGFEANEGGWQNGYSTFEWTLSDTRLRMTDVAISRDGSTIAIGSSLQSLLPPSGRFCKSSKGRPPAGIPRLNRWLLRPRPIRGLIFTVS